MTNWLISWKTWWEDQIDTPWPFQLIEHTSDFKKRKTGEKISEDYVDSVYLSGNEDLALQFESNYISAVVLATMIDADTAESASASIKSVFPDAEIVSVVVVPDEFVDYVSNQLKSV